MAPRAASRSLLPPGALAAGRREILAMLRRRGLEGRARSGRATLLLPSGRRGEERFYGFLRHYSFRLLLRDVLAHRDSFSAADLQKYCSADAVRRWVAALERAGVVRRSAAGRHRLAKPRVRSFGDTLEWLVAAVLERELGVPALGGLRIAGLPGGGDCDVLGLVEGRLLYVETKASPPRHIERRNVAAFLDRIEALRPDAAVFLEDTKLRMKDKLVPMFGDELGRRFGGAAPPMRRIAGEVFGAGDRLFLANADPDVAVTLGVCVRRYLGSRPSCVPRRDAAPGGTDGADSPREATGTFRRGPGFG